MRTILIAGNWKMHGSREQNASLVRALVDQVEISERASMLICPPGVYLSDVSRQLNGSGIFLGGQNCSTEATGAHTGELSADMLKDVGCQYVIVGHSERRALYGETDSVVARKFLAAQKAGLIPILCVGETLDEREQGVTNEVIRRQLIAVLDLCGVQAFARAVVAYEPVWAIGTGKTASPEQAQEVHAFMRGLIGERDVTIADSIQLLYGGSMKASNAAQLLAMRDVDGGLVGGASLQADEFIKIFEAAA
ncbi:MAG: triose-phosphate isomerase [Gammaproteobacteria bacterium]|nr:triose-phosphate isomerase [Gammaproteobacteria bacterium]